MPYTRVSKKPEEQPTRGKTAANRLRQLAGEDHGRQTVDRGGIGVQHELPPGVRDPRFSGGAAEELYPSRGRGRTDLRFLRSVEAVRGRDRRDEDLWIKAVVYPCGGSAGAKGIQAQFAEEIFSEGIFDLGTIGSPGRQRTSH